MSEEAYNVAVRFSASVGGLYKTMIAELGLEETLTIADLQGKGNGAGFVDGLKQMGGFTPENMAKLIDQAYLPMGLVNNATPERTPSTQCSLKHLESR